MFIVSSTATAGAGSLREALATAPDNATILITVSGTMTLDTPLICQHSVTLQGMSHESLTISGATQGRIFEIAAHATVSLHGMTLCDGYAEQGGAILNRGTLHISDCVLHHNVADEGGAIANFGTLQMQQCHLHHNHATSSTSGGGAMVAMPESSTTISQSHFSANLSAGYGGAILSHATLQLSSTTFSTNQAHHSGGAIRQQQGILHLERCALHANHASAGGAIWLQPSCTASLNESLFEQNYAERLPASTWNHPNGGAIWNNGGSVEVLGCTFAGNHAERNSGAIHTRDFHHPGSLLICNSTFSANSAGRSGGVLCNYGSTEIITSTLVQNHARQNGGGIVNGARGRLHLFGTILTDNHAAHSQNASGILTSRGYNLLDATEPQGYTLKGELDTNVSGDPQLGSLRDNGGATPTLAPKPTSPVINVIPPQTWAMSTDQRGHERPSTHAWCVGAVQLTALEAHRLRLPSPTVSDSVAARAADLGASPMFEPYPRALDLPPANLAHELRQAIEHDAFRLTYQPVVQIHSGQPFAFTTLLRWEHPKWGILMPDLVLKLAQMCGMSRHVDRWVMQQVVKQATGWPLYGSTPLISFHLTPETLYDDDIIRELDLLFATHGVSGSQFLIEVSAPLLPTDPDTLATIAAVLAGIQQLLCGVALDQVSGTTPLATLQQLPLDALLLDRTCVSNLHNDLNAAAVIQTLIGFAQNKGIPPIITGIEQSSQLEWLMLLGCEYGQGYHFARPLAAAELHLDASYGHVITAARTLFAPFEEFDPTPFELFADPYIEQQPSSAPIITPIGKSYMAPPFPRDLSDSDAVLIGYRQEIAQAAHYLDHNLSVLITCDKALVERLAYHIIEHSAKTAVFADDPVSLDEDDTSNREALADLISKMKPSQALVLHHLDLVVDNRPDWPLINTARSLVALFYRKQRNPPTLLAFADPSLNIPRILRERFNVQLEIGGIHRETITQLVTSRERDRFDRFSEGALFKHVAEMNVIQFRTAMRFLAQSSIGVEPSYRLLQQLQPFRRDTRTQIEIPDVTFDMIGGYNDVKQQVFEAIELITGRPVPYTPDGTPLSAQAQQRLAELLPETPDERELRRKLAPRGLIFYGPPGTGKTLFAKAIANVMQATLQLISGPEIMSKWIGESEGNLRQIFATARRNAPAVILFDEFDSIAGKRSGFNDSGSREMNAVVSQLLTELDGFQEDQEILVIGTTNRLDMIDKALLRPSRLQPIAIGLPDRTARRQIAAIHLGTFQVELPSEELLDMLAERTEGFSGDEVRAIIQGVARRARRGEPVDRETFYTQLDRVQKFHQEHHRLRLDNEDMVH